MKKRVCFVSNSSSQSYVCNICDRKESGWDALPWELGFRQCACGHVFCDEHALEGDEDSATDKKVLLIVDEALCRKCFKWIRKAPLLSKRRFILNSSERKLKKSILLSPGSGMVATIAETSMIFIRPWIKTVLPVPTSPVSNRKPLFSRIPYLSVARASLCFSPSHRNFGSVVIWNGLIFKL